MKKAPIPSDEEKRLRQLLRYQVLDTGAERSFDDITELAAAISGKKVALVSLIDSDRQWFKSKVGLDATETPRDISFCGHAIHHDEILYVPNVLDDERFFDNPLVEENPNIRFYAGAPLKTPSGHRIGTLCVIDDEPGELSDWQKKALQRLANIVIDQLESRKSQIDLQERFKALQESGRKVADLKGQLKSAEKFSALGEMAGNLSHEINNPLAIMMGKLSIAKKLIQRGEDSIENVVEIIEHTQTVGKRISNTVRTLLSMSKNHENEPMSDFTLEEALDTSFLLLSEKMRALDIQIRISDTDREMWLRGRKNAFSQVLFNLFSNSIDALSTVPKKKIAIELHQTDADTVIDFSDSGEGVKKGRDIFEAFHSSKKEYGTGLGLYLSRDLMENMGGSLSLKQHSPPIFRLELPRTETRAGKAS